MRGWTWAVGAAMLAVALPASAAQAQQPPSGAVERLAPGTGSFMFSGWPGKPLEIFYYVPRKVDADTRVLMVLHGMGRAAANYRDAWVKQAEAGNYIVVTPLFTAKDFPGSRTYNIGNVQSATGELLPRDRWTFGAIEPLFDEVRRRTGTRTPSYAVYGHSAGSQFLHRFLFLVPEARFSHMILANAGWYTMPDLKLGYPNGLGGLPVDNAGLAAGLGKRITVLLGTADIDPAHHQLLRTPEAMAQGPHRMSRGQFYYAKAKSAAAALRTPFRWKIAYVPDVAHSTKGMSQGAAPLLWQR